jgi:multidrug efflux system membrane fusion protein
VQAQLTGDNKLAVDVFDRANDHLIESGTLASLDNQVDTTTGTVRFRAEFPNTDQSLFPNQFVNARLLVQTLQQVTLVPTVALQHNGTNDFVYVLKQNNTVAVQQVTALTTNEQDTAVKGIDPGLTVATTGFDRLENNAQVAVRTPRAKSGQQGKGGKGGPDEARGSSTAAR